jgi:hypothetical protein
MTGANDVQPKRFRARTLIVVAVVASVATAARLVLFRTESIVAPKLGHATLKWRWGSAAETLFDTNSDGITDIRLTYERWSTTFRTHEPYSESWESTLCNGRFDRHTVLGADGRVLRVEYDSDGDGSLESSAKGLEAERFLKTHPVSDSCGWGLTPPFSKDAG